MRPLLPAYQFAALGLIILLVIGSAIFGILELRGAMTEQVYDDDRALADLSAQLLQERFDRVSDLSLSLASRVRFRELVAAGEWEKAIQILSSIPADFPFVERIIMTDLAGTLMADLPTTVPSVRGQNFAHRDWYRGVSASGKPYVSNVYQRAAPPALTIIAVAAPINTPSESKERMGYLALQLRLETLLEWSRETDFGPDTYAIFVDREGSVAAHPSLDPQAGIVSYASVSWVRSALAGGSGITTVVDPITHEDQLVAYRPVDRYGWAVGVAKPATEAFAVRDRTLATAGAIAVIVIDLTIILIIVVIRGFAKLQEAKNEFIVTATHQLKTPLVGLRWTLDSLRIPPEALNEQQRTYLANLKRFGDMMVRSVDELLDVSRIELGTLQLEISQVDTRELLDRLVADMSYYASVRGHAVTLWVAPDVPRTMEIDQRMVYHVLQNLVSNAVDYSMPGTAVEVRALSEDGEIRIEVQNQGDAISSEAQQHLFEKFYRAPEAKRVKAVGTGIGLYIAKSFVQRWDGRIGFISAAGKTVFWITIPAQRVAEPGDTKPHLSTQPI